jgi:C1A family cysteine protease
MKKIFNWFKKLFGLEYKPGKNAKFGWKRDIPDPRDHKFMVSMPLKVDELPPLVDLKPLCPPVYDQGNIGSCTANAMGCSFQFEQMSQKIPNFIPSRLFIYYNSRDLEGTINEDAGATLRDTLKTMIDIGVCPEKNWPYNKCFKKKPSSDCYVIALDNQVVEYLRVNHDLLQIKQCLFEGHPVAFGVTLYDSFMTEAVANSGIVPMPNLQVESVLGGHAILAVGYDDSKKALIMRNSWGIGWGINGYFYLPYEYITTPNLAADFWTIRLVETPVIIEQEVETIAKPKKTRKKSNNK